MKKILLLSLMLFAFSFAACSHHKKGHDHPRKAASCGAECTSCDKSDCSSCDKSECSSCSKSGKKECPYMKQKREGKICSPCGQTKANCSCKK